VSSRGVEAFLGGGLRAGRRVHWRNLKLALISDARERASAVGQALSGMEREAPEGAAVLM
jgi:hypothetical protein